MDEQPSHAVTTASAIPFKQMPSTRTALGTSGVAILVISLVAISVALYLRKRFNLVAPSNPANKRIRVLETQMLGPRALLAVVEFGGREHLIAHSEHGVTRIADVEAGRHDR